MGLLRTLRDPITYGFASGRVKVFQTRMLSWPRLERLLEAENLADLQRTILETEYGPRLREVTTMAEAEAALEDYTADLYRFLEESNVPDAAILYFRRPHDYFNLKVLVKARLRGEKPEPVLSPHGKVPIERMEAAAEAGSWAGLPDTLASAAADAIERHRATGRIESVDAACDRAMYAELVALAASLKTPFMRRLTATVIDMANLKLVARAARREEPDSFVGEALPVGGHASREQWLDAYRSAERETPVSRLLAEAGYKGLPEAVFGDMPVDALDIWADNQITHLVRDTGRLPVGLELVVGYVLGRQIEIKMIRVALTHLLAGVPKELARRRLRLLYV